MTSDDPKKAVKDLGGRAAEASNEAVENARAGAGKVGGTVRDFAARASDTANDMYGDAKDRVRDAVDRLPDGSDAIESGRRAYEKSSRTVGRHVAKQPLEALLLAGAIGYLVGWATNRS